MNEKEEEAYLRGMKAAWIQVATTATKHLGAKERNEVDLIRERHEAINVLRELCEEYGDNDWDDDLYLSDIIEKHLGDYLIDMFGNLGKKK
jgi:hypothetical protein